ncbi:MAG: transglutaminase domain-containing protein [Firmicutes bacterium]|nr:transglutaminase domain-containing protein [Bacillota bacterium]
MGRYSSPVTYKNKVWTKSLLFLAIWTLLVLYPNPHLLVLSIYRTLKPPVNPAAVESLIAHVPPQPADIDNFISSLIPYQHDWQTYNVPWYFPTVEEAVAKRAGDCKSQFIVLASMLKALEIPHRLSYSLTHFWVIYENKMEMPLERESNAFLIRSDGQTIVKVPQEEVKQIRQIFWESFWEAMPPVRKQLFLIGPFLSLALGLFAGAHGRLSTVMKMS